MQKLIVSRGEVCLGAWDGPISRATSLPGPNPWEAGEPSIQELVRPHPASPSLEFLKFTISPCSDMRGIWGENQWKSQFHINLETDTSHLKTFERADRMWKNISDRTRLCRLGFGLRFGLWSCTSQNRRLGFLLVDTQVQALAGLETLHQLLGSLYMETIHKLFGRLQLYVPARGWGLHAWQIQNPTVSVGASPPQVIFALAAILSLLAVSSSSFFPSSTVTFGTWRKRP